MSKRDWEGRGAVAKDRSGQDRLHSKGDNSADLTLLGRIFSGVRKFPRFLLGKGTETEITQLSFYKLLVL